MNLYFQALPLILGWCLGSYLTQYLKPIPDYQLATDRCINDFVAMSVIVLYLGLTS